MEVKQVQHESLTTQRYPWTHRVGFADSERHNALPVLQWTEVNNIPGIWAGNAFYTTGKYATMIMIKWSE